MSEGRWQEMEIIVPDAFRQESETPALRGLVENLRWQESETPALVSYHSVRHNERIGMNLFLPSGLRACSVDKIARSVSRITGHRTVSKAFSVESSLHVQGWRPVSYSYWYDS